MSPEYHPGHIPVLKNEVCQLLDPKVGEIWVDCTLGMGGHTRILADRVGPTGLVIAIEQDQEMIELTKNRNFLPDWVRIFHGNFDQLGDILRSVKISQVNGVLADFGFCSAQMDDPNRGFSFREQGPLDMRLDQSRGETVSQLLNRISEYDLANLIYQYGGERHSRKIARLIKETLKQKPLQTTTELASLVRQVVPREKDRHFDPATRTFQALRIAVNDELGAIERLFAVLPSLIVPNGKVGVISFHSLEDRMVKLAFKKKEIWEALTSKPVTATEQEIQENPRSRSAKLRVARRKTENELNEPSPA